MSKFTSPLGLKVSDEAKSILRQRAIDWGVSQNFIGDELIKGLPKENPFKLRVTWLEPVTVKATGETPCI